jgi:hypothetical protein
METIRFTVFQREGQERSVMDIRELEADTSREKARATRRKLMTEFGFQLDRLLQGDIQEIHVEVMS